MVFLFAASTKGHLKTAGYPFRGSLGCPSTQACEALNATKHRRSNHDAANQTWRSPSTPHTHNLVNGDSIQGHCLGLTDTFAQVGGQANAGYALLLDTSQWSIYDPFNLSLSGFAFDSYGGTAGAFGYNPPTYDNGLRIGGGLSDLTGGGVVVGGSASAGFWGGLTTANVSQDLSAWSGTLNGNVGFGPVQFGASLSQSSTASTFTISPPGFGLSFGLSVSGYRTYTDVYK